MKKQNTLDEMLFGIGKKLKGNPEIYHNTKALLKVYNKVIWCLEHSVREMEAECAGLGYDNLYETLSYLASSIDSELDSLRLEERARNLLFTNALVNIVNRALIMLKSYPGKGERYFEIINKMHLLKYRYTEGEMLDCLHMSRRSLYREKREAIDLLGVILWGFLIPDLLKGFAGT
jgi:hypothetical protein